MPIKEYYSENKRINRDDKKEFIQCLRINYLNNGYSIKSIEKYRYNNDKYITVK